VSDETAPDQPVFAIAALAGYRLRTERKAQHLSLKEVAGRVGISFQELSSIERGKINTPIETLYRIATALGLVLDDVVQTSSGYHAVTPHVCATLRDTEHKVHEVLQLVQSLAQMLCPAS
jgi:transcriptional regulator with XRE-family HTH domain